MKQLEVKLPHKQYPIYIKDGILEDIPQYLGVSAKKLAIVTDENVHSFYGEKIASMLDKTGIEYNLTIIEPGEGSKSIAVLERLYAEWISAGITRSDRIMALGGGIVGDLTGFAASTYLRGIPYIQVPTSLLAMVDSSVGGKVAVNLPQGKNLVGSFYHPDAVFIDPLVLDTLPERNFREGMAEVIKYGCICDEKLFKTIEESTLNGIRDELGGIIIKRCCEIKKDVVQEDERDTGGRMILNFGHTIGHAVEKIYGFKAYSHGEAVAIGMAMITRISESIGITSKGTAKRIIDLLLKYGLPVRVKDFDANEIFSATTVDKKVKDGKINMILINKIGEVIIHPYSIEDWRGVLNENS